MRFIYWKITEVEELHRDEISRSTATSVNVFEHAGLLAALRPGLSVGADLGDRVKVSAGGARQPVRDAAVAHHPGVIVDSRSALDEAVRTRRIGEQRARIVHALVVARIHRRVCPSATTQPISRPINRSIHQSIDQSIDYKSVDRTFNQSITQIFIADDRFISD